MRRNVLQQRRGDVAAREHAYGRRPARWLSPFLIVLTVVLTLAACGPDAGGSTALSPSTLKVDNSVKPAVATVLDLTTGAPLPVAALKQADGSETASFVEGRVLVSTSNSADLQAFLTRWGGTVVDMINMQNAGLKQTPNLYDVKIDPSKASPDALPQDLHKINAKQRADLIVSSDVGSHTLAAAVHEAATTHLTVGLDWLALPDSEAPVANVHGALGNPGASTSDYDTSAANWPYMNQGSPQNIGVAAAWGLLGPTSPRIKVAVLDGGFCGTADLPADAEFFPPSPTCAPNTWHDSTGGTSQYHGAETAATAFGVANNFQGAAGVAGRVAQPLLVRSPGANFFSILHYIVSTLPSVLAHGPRILNISAGFAVPGPVFFLTAFLTGPVVGLFAGLRTAGILTFASAGNNGKNIDQQQCFLGVCWQKNVWIPCQLPGVVCVGGLAVNSTSHSPGSNYSSGSDVQIYAPFDVWTVGATDGDVRTDAAHSVSGTSFSSPFAAGVAALIWSMNPSLSANDVERILLSSAHTGSPDRYVPRWVDAYSAVAAAQQAPEVTITSPRNGQSFYVGADVPLRVRAVEPVSGRILPDSTITWTVDGRALPDHASALTYQFTSAGSHTIGASATNEGGTTTRATSISVTVTNPPPVTILAPTEGQRFYQGSDGTVVINFQAGNASGWTLTWRDVTHGSPGTVIGTGASPHVRLRPASCAAYPYTVNLVATNGSSTITRTVHFVIDCLH